MSKGSQQRPGEGYAENWQRIFSSDEVSEKAPPPQEVPTDETKEVPP